MTGPHSPWPLFGNDLDLARSWIRPQLSGAVSLRTGYVAISLGMGETLLAGLESGVFQATPDVQRRWRFRVARLHKDPNPYRHLLEEALYERTLTVIEHKIKTGQQICVQLHGGIGDHLEALCMLLPWAREKHCNLDLVMSASRRRLIEPVLPPWEVIRCKTISDQGTVSIPLMALKAAVIGNAERLHYRSWLLREHDRHKSSRHWLFCWRAEGTGDKLSAHSRSVPFSLVKQFYDHLRRLQPQSCIVDITYWKEWEAMHLRDIGVEVLDPRQGTLLELVRRCRSSRVVTIDTALVHLCAAAGQRAELLLNLFPDERWQELHRPEHNYGQLINIRQSSQFGSWSAVMASLATSVTEASS